LVGAEPRPVKIEATVSASNRGSFTIVGLPDTAVRESRERVRAAMKEQGFHFPGGRVVVNLSPADLPKIGVTFDLPIALSVIAASHPEPVSFDGFVCVGELSLHGHVKPVRAVLGATVIADRQDKACMVATSSVVAVPIEARVVGIETLRQAVRVASGQTSGDVVMSTEMPDTPASLDMATVRGHAFARRALEVAAAGGHHLLMVGSPGAGKTMLARCLPGILPALQPREVREVGLIHAAAGSGLAVTNEAPFRAPHHSASLAALVGGGSGIPTPGEVSLAHRGVLFLDELGEFNPSVLDALRQPIEHGEIVVARQGATVKFPSSVQVVAASNPCPCGYWKDHRTPCECTDAKRGRYRTRLSGPLLDRFDLRIHVERLTANELIAKRGESSREVRRRVTTARAVQRTRPNLNRDLTRDELDDLPVSVGGRVTLKQVAGRDKMTARGWDRIRRVARTLADLDGADMVDTDHVQEAERFRGESP
jgi:magnesium chelatase family protein